MATRAVMMVAAAAVLVACGDDGPAEGTYGDPSVCGAIAQGCFKEQKACAVIGGEGACRACPKGEAPTLPDGGCAPIPGTAIAHDFGDYTLEGGEEIGSLCRTWILDNDTELWVNAVELDNGGGFHHSNWFFVPEDFQGWPTEPWRDCYGEGFDEVTAALAGGVLYAQSTQVEFELQKFQSGAAIRVPPRSRVIGATHLLNYHPEPLTTGLEMTLHTLEPGEVDIALTPAQLIYTDLNIPPEQRSVVAGDCDLDAAHRDVTDRPLDMKIHYILPHYHELGDAMTVQIWGGDRDGEELVALGRYKVDPYGRAFNPPIDLAGATGLSFTCGFDNPRDEVVHWGIGDQEMCEALLFVEGDMAFSARVAETTSVDETVEGLERHSGSCDVTGFPYSPPLPE